MAKHTSEQLAQLQSMPLSAKIEATKRRISEWYEYWEGQVYVSFSGGKDSTVLKHIVDNMYNDVPAVFVNTGLEYPEIQKFAMSQTNVVITRPEIRFDEVLKVYGYPIASKRVAQTVETVRNGKCEGARWEMLNGLYKTKEGEKSQFNVEKWKFLVDASFNTSAMCCNEMKKKPMKKYQKETGRKPIIGTMASEGQSRYMAWLKTGCNAFDKKEPSSQPLSFWTEQDILHYIKKYDVPYCSVYGDIVPTSDQEELEGQITTFDILGNYEDTLLKTTGCNRTGCIFCAFGCHLEKEPNRFQQLKETHPRQYEYCINGGCYDKNGRWIPNKEGLGMGHVFDELNKVYGEDFIKYK